MPLRRWFGGPAAALLLLSISMTAATGIAAPAATAVAATAAQPGTAQELPVVPIYQVVPSPVQAT
jgi:hypothetical protein